MTLSHCDAGGLVSITFDSFELTLLTGVLKESGSEEESIAHAEWRRAASDVFHAAGLVALLVPDHSEGAAVCASYIDGSLDQVRKEFNS